MGDFNGHVGHQFEGEENNDKTIMGSFTYGHRNCVEEQVTNLVFSHRLQVGNSYFKKKNTLKWAWLSPKGKKY